MIEDWKFRVDWSGSGDDWQNGWALFETIEEAINELESGTAVIWTQRIVAVKTSGIGHARSLKGLVVFAKNGRKEGYGQKLSGSYFMTAAKNRHFLYNPNWPREANFWKGHFIWSERAKARGIIVGAELNSEFGVFYTWHRHDDPNSMEADSEDNLWWDPDKPLQILPEKKSLYKRAVEWLSS